MYIVSCNVCHKMCTVSKIITENLKSDTLGGFLPLETGNENYPAHCQMKLKYTNPFV